MIVDMALYENGVRRRGDVDLEQAFEACRRPECFAWIGLFEPTRAEFDAVRREFGLHELAAEDAVKAHQRPKIELYGDTLFVVLKTARYVDEGDQVELGEILVFVGEGFVISVRHGETALHDVRLRLEGRPDLLKLGPGAALYAIIDRSSTTTARSRRRSTRTSGSSRPRSSPRPRIPPSRSTSSSGRCSSCTARSPR